MSFLWIVCIRLFYNYRALDSRLELFVDIVNLFDNQNTIRNQDLLAGTEGMSRPLLKLGGGSGEILRDVLL